MLGELAELDLALAKHVHARALATEDPAQVAELSRAYQCISRCVRQTLALKAKLRRDAQQHARWLGARGVRPPTPASTPVPAPADRGARRRAELEDAVTRVIGAEREYEGPDWESRQARRFEYLDNLLAGHSRRPGFGQGPLDEDVVAFCADLGLSRRNALNWRALPEPDFDEGGDEDTAEPRRSSA